MMTTTCWMGVAGVEEAAVLEEWQPELNPMRQEASAGTATDRSSEDIAFLPCTAAGARAGILVSNASLQHNKAGLVRPKMGNSIANGWVEIAHWRPCGDRLKRSHQGAFGTEILPRGREPPMALRISVDKAMRDQIPLEVCR